VRAVAQHPEANSWFDWEGIKQFTHVNLVTHVNLGFAVDTGQALLVPVIRSADTMTLSELSQAARTAVDKARAGALAPDEMDGGSFTVSNLGGLGVHCLRRCSIRHKQPSWASELPTKVIQPGPASFRCH
jgi:pyruvate dehydrogenase E2 component (dihydrolipoamide acetyltransferase)